MTQNIGCQWQSTGNICNLYIQGHIEIPTGWTNYTLAYNLPAPKFGFNPIGIVQNQDSGKAYVIVLNKSGQLIIRSDANPCSGWIRGVITYVREL